MSVCRLLKVKGVEDVSARDLKFELSFYSSFIGFKRNFEPVSVYLGFCPFCCQCVEVVFFAWRIVIFTISHSSFKPRLIVDAVKYKLTSG